MKITICSSMFFAKEMIQIESKLKNKGHEIILPKNTELYANESLSQESRKESSENKIKHNLIKEYYKKIADSDAVLVINNEKNNIKHYIGGNSLIEMAFAHILDKKLFLLNPIPNLKYADEIKAMKPIILNGDLDKIK
jgi:predicted RNA-binding protein with PUA domain